MLLTTKRLTENLAPPLHQHPNWGLNVCAASFFFVCDTNTYIPVCGVFLCGHSLFTHSCFTFSKSSFPQLSVSSVPVLFEHPTISCLFKDLANTHFYRKMLHCPHTICHFSLVSSSGHSFSFRGAFYNVTYKRCIMVKVKDVLN